MNKRKYYKHVVVSRLLVGRNTLDSRDMGVHRGSCMKGEQWVELHTK